MENLKPNKLTIITPSYRINNLLEIKKSLNFEYIEEGGIFRVGFFGFG
jgi:hypothetical protein